jgi:hypothetical protein
MIIHIVSVSYFIDEPAGLNYGTLPVGVNCKAIIARAKPQF